MGKKSTTSKKSGVVKAKPTVKKASALKVESKTVSPEEDRISEVSNVHVVLRRHSQWQDHRQLCQFKIQFGHCRVPSSYTLPIPSAWDLRFEPAPAIQE